MSQPLLGKLMSIKTCVLLRALSRVASSLTHRSAFAAISLFSRVFNQPYLENRLFALLTILSHTETGHPRSLLSVGSQLLRLACQPVTRGTPDRTSVSLYISHLVVSIRPTAIATAWLEPSASIQSRPSDVLFVTTRLVCSTSFERLGESTTWFHQALVSCCWSGGRQNQYLRYRYRRINGDLERSSIHRCWIRFHLMYDAVSLMLTRYDH